MNLARLVSAALLCVAVYVGPVHAQTFKMPCEVEGIGPGLSTMLIHESGEYIRGTVGLRPIKGDPQSMGAAMTYARRYGLQAVLGITADDDDDGNQASKPATARQSAPMRRPATEELKQLLTSKGFTWKASIHAINGAEGSDYLESHLPDDILTDHLARFCDHLRTLPAKAVKA